MRSNEAIAEILEDIARILDVLGEDAFRAIAHTRAARAISSLTGDISALAKDRKALLATDGIGRKIADKVIEFCTTGKVKEHEELRARVPSGVLDLLQIPGLGPKSASVMWKQGGIDSLAKLEAAMADGSLAKLPRMGEKSVEKLRQSLALARTAGDRLWLGRAQGVADVFLSRLRASPHVERVEVAGSLRRGRETIGDIDILVALKPGHEGDAGQVSEAFRSTPGVVQVISAGDGKSSVRVSLSNDFGRWSADDSKKDGPSIQVDLRVLPLASWGAGLLYFTGSKEHNIRLRQRAIEMGYRLSEWGLFKDEGGPDPAGEATVSQSGTSTTPGKSKRKATTKAAAGAAALDDAAAGPRTAKPDVGDQRPPHERGVIPIAAASEEDVYAALKLPWYPPEMREDRGEHALAGSPDLVSLQDIKAELHAHTTASDGHLSIVELAEEAKRRGFHTIAVTDHSKSSLQAKGLSVDRLLQQIEDVKKAREKVQGITILAGSEVDILVDGSLDYDDSILRQLDIVVGSPHASLSQDPEKATNRLLAAIRHPRLHILGHPTGRLINRRQGLEPDMPRLFAAAKEHGVAMEVNSHWYRLDLRDQHVRLAMEVGCLIAIDCDVHQTADFDNLRFGVSTARRGWCTKAACVNAWPAEKLHAWLKAER